MDPITTAVVHTATTESAAALKKESDGFLKAVLGEPAKALGGLLADKINKRRHANLIKITVDAKRKLDEAGVSPKEVPLKIIHPLLDAASLEENPDMQTRWANLLAAAADPRAEALPPSFPKILSEMSSREAKFLDGLHEHLVETGPKPMTEMAFSMPFRRGELLGLYTGSGEFSVEAFNVDVDSLLRFRLIENEPPHVDRDAILSGEPYLENNVVYRMTSLGSLFVKTCKSK